MHNNFRLVFRPIFVIVFVVFLRNRITEGKLIFDLQLSDLLDFCDLLDFRDLLLSGLKGN